MKKTTSIISFVLCLLALGTPRTSAQTTVVTGSGAVVASNGQTLLLGTIGQGAAGLTAGPGTAAEQGFWHGSKAILPSAGEEVAAPGRSSEASLLTLSGTPNPFSRSTLLSFTVPRRDHVSLVLYNTIGQPVLTLIDEERDPGTVAHQADLAGLPSGSYTALLRIGNRQGVTTLLLID